MQIFTLSLEFMQLCWPGGVHSQMLKLVWTVKVGFACSQTSELRRLSATNNLRWNCFSNSSKRHKYFVLNCVLFFFINVLKNEFICILMLLKGMT